MPLAPTEAVPQIHRPSEERPPVPIGYAAALPALRVSRPLWAAAAALALALALLGTALYALLSLARLMTIARPMNFDQNTWAIVSVLIPIFAGVCTLAALVCLGVGLKWLGSSSRTVG